MAASGRKKAVITGMIGNGLEWYDYALYGHMAVVFATLFFPSSDSSFSLILTFLTFAAGFVSRPIGAVIFGRIGDKYGRKKALTASMILMAVPTGCIGLLPTYEMIGVAAPILLLTIRILQGLSLGGAFSGSMSYVVEHADPKQRALTGSVTMLSLVIGFLMGSLVSALVSAVLPQEDFISWGWRVPFFFGVLIGVVGFWLRNHGEESPVYKEAKESGLLSETPVKDCFFKFPLKMFQGFSIYMCVTIPFYIVAIYMIAYSKQHLGLSQDQALLGNALAMVAMFLPILPAAKAADKYGRRKVLMGSIIALLIAAYPCFMLMQGGTFWEITAAQMILAAITGWYLAPIPALLVELFPTSIRYTGLSLSYNFSAILGGFTPAFAEFLIGATDSKMSITSLLVFAGATSFMALLLYKDRFKEKLA